MHYFPCCLAKEPESVMSGTWNYVATSERQHNTCLNIVYNPQPEQTTVIDNDSICGHRHYNILNYASAHLHLAVRFWTKSLFKSFSF